MMTPRGRGQVEEESFSYKGKILRFRKATGLVIGINDRSEIHVRSSGGGGHVGPQGGYVPAPRIHSVKTDRLEIWIKTDSGSEECFDLPTTDIPLREGQRITFIFYVGQEDKNHVSILVNHDANRHWFLLTADALAEGLAINPTRAILGSLALRSSAVIHTLMSRLVIVHLAALGLAYMIYTKTHSPLLAGGVAGTLWLLYIVKMRKEFTDMHRKVEAHLERLVEAAYAQQQGQAAA